MAICSKSARSRSSPPCSSLRPTSVATSSSENGAQCPHRRDAQSRLILIHLLVGGNHGRRYLNRDRDPAPAENRLPPTPRDPDNASAWYENIKEVQWQTSPPLAIGLRLAFVASFMGRRLAYTYEIVDLQPGKRLVMSTKEGPFPMETTYTWEDTTAGATRMTLRNRGMPAGFSRLSRPSWPPACERLTKKIFSASKNCLKPIEIYVPAPHRQFGYYIILFPLPPSPLNPSLKQVPPKNHRPPSYLRASIVSPLSLSPSLPLLPPTPHAHPHPPRRLRPS